jgi:hypothetical protein
MLRNVPHDFQFCGLMVLAYSEDTVFEFYFKYFVKSFLLENRDGE